jgi:endonuclease/exonuclease/phosphatase family metal-dependent hydrolase
MEPDRTEPPPPRALKVMSYNVQGHGARLVGRYLERIARVIAEEKPDLVGLQEVHRRTWLARFEDQAEALGRLTGMKVHFGASFAKKGGEFGNALLTHGEVRSTAVHSLPGSGEPRTILESLVEVHGGELRFLVTHLAAWGRLGSGMRSRQVLHVAERLHAITEPFVMVGDLNAPPDAPELRNLVAAQLFRSCGGLECTHRMTRQRLDYVFADPGWTTVSARVLRVGPSDHWPVVVELLRQPGRPETALS